MTYAIILAGGKGTRVNDNIELPKQFRNIGETPILIITLKKFISVNKFDRIYITVAKEFISYTQELLKKYNINLEKISIINGGKERIDSIENAAKSIKKEQEINDDDIVVIHDGVRPFVSTDLINKSIKAAQKYKAVVCAVKATDTLFISDEGEKIDKIPKRSKYYKGQSPDAYNVKIFIELLSKIKEEDKKKITGDAEVCILNNYPVHILDGDDLNFKITSISDFIIAEQIAKGENYNR